MSELLTAFEIASKKVPSHPIPPMTDPMGKHWPQPDRFGIEIDDKHALMSQVTFEKILDYTNSQPSGVYPGKMFKKGNRNNDLERGRWWLHWWTEHPTDPSLCCNNVREIIIV